MEYIKTIFESNIEDQSKLYVIQQLQKNVEMHPQEINLKDIMTIVNDITKNGFDGVNFMNLVCRHTLSNDSNNGKRNRVLENDRNNRLEIEVKRNRVLENVNDYNEEEENMNEFVKELDNEANMSELHQDQDEVSVNELELHQDQVEVNVLELHQEQVEVNMNDELGNEVHEPIIENDMVEINIQTSKQPVRIGYRKFEDDSLIDAMKKLGTKWSLIQKLIGHLLPDRKGSTWAKDRAIVLKKYSRSLNLEDVFQNVPWKGGVEDHRPYSELEAIYQKNKNIQQLYQIESESESVNGNEIKKQDKIDIDIDKIDTSGKNRLSVICICGKEHECKKLLMEGIQCVCKISKENMLLIITKTFDTVVYIVLLPGSSELTDKIEYIGVSSHLDHRIQYHNHIQVKDADISQIRISLILGETDMINLLKPMLNAFVGGTCISKMTKLKRGNDWVNVDITENTGSKYNTLLIDSINGNIVSNNVLSTCGLIFGNKSYSNMDDTTFCFLNKDTCNCNKKCYYRRIQNYLQGKPIWSGIPVSKVRNNIRDYKETVHVKYGEPNPIWNEDYTKRIIDRNEKIKDDTRKGYKSKIGSLWKEMTFDNDSLMNSLWMPWQFYTELKKRRWILSTRKTMVVAIMSMISHMTNTEILKVSGINASIIRHEYREVYNILVEELEENTQKFNDRERRNWVTTKELMEAIQKMENDCVTMYDKQRVLWYKMQIIQGATRNDGRTLKIGNYDKDNDNYICMESKQIVYNDYKTSWAMKRQEFEIRDELLMELSEMITFQIGIHSDYLFSKICGGEFSSSEFGNHMMNGISKYIGNKRVGSQMIRKIVTSEYREGEKSIQEKDEWSRRMLHSSGMSEKYRRIF